MAELLIKGGMVIDGTGNAGYEADVFVKDGKIAKTQKLRKTKKPKQVRQILQRQLYRCWMQGESS